MYIYYITYNKINILQQTNKIQTGCDTDSGHFDHDQLEKYESEHLIIRLLSELNQMIQ